MSEPAREWRDDALCLIEDPELFFTIGDGHWAPSQTGTPGESAAVLGTQPCLQAALAISAQHGICGGTAPEERGKIARHIIAVPGPGRQQ